MSYSSSLTDKEWEILEPLVVEIVPTKKRTRPTNWTKRELLNGIFYQLKNGCNWEDLPKDLPPYSTVYWHYKQWRKAGAIEKLMMGLHGQVREQVKKKPSGQHWSSLTSVAVQNTCNASVESKGFCFYKLTNGIKRHLAVDTLGFPFFTHCTKANLSDDAGLPFDVDTKHRLLPVEARQYPEGHDLDRPRLSPRPSDAGARKEIPADHAKDQVWTFNQALETREGSGRKVGVCSSNRSVGNRTVKCLDGALQDPGKEFWANPIECDC